jgi:hypothetical protein
MMKWSGRIAKTLDQVDYIIEINKLWGQEDHDIIILTKENITRMHVVVE